MGIIGETSASFICERSAVSCDNSKNVKDSDLARPPSPSEAKTAPEFCGWMSFMTSKLGLNRLIQFSVDNLFLFLITAIQSCIASASSDFVTDLLEVLSPKKM